MKATSPAELAAFDEMVRVLGGCKGCDFDEAEGLLVCHCAKCQFKVTVAAWRFAGFAIQANPARKAARRKGNRKDGVQP